MVLMRVLIAVLTILAVASAGCFPLAIAKTKDEVVDEQDLGSRPSRAHADIDGHYCFVDHETRTTKKAFVNSWFRVGGAFNALLFGLSMSFNPIVGVIALDGLMAFVYGVAKNGKQRTTTTWEPTTETTVCAN